MAAGVPVRRELLFAGISTVKENLLGRSKLEAAFDFLGVVDQGEAFSARNVGLLRRLKLIFAIIAAYEVLGFVGISIATLVAMGQTKALMFLGWIAAEVVTLFLFTLVALLERLFATALKLRQENELKV